MGYSYFREPAEEKAIQLAKESNMFKITNPFKVIPVRTVPVSEFKEARDMHSFAFHIEKGQGNPLCGTTNAMYGNKVVTVEEVVNSISKQHDGWYWCADCGAAFTNFPKAAFIEARNSRGK